MVEPKYRPEYAHKAIEQKIEYWRQQPGPQASARTQAYRNALEVLVENYFTVYVQSDPLEDVEEGVPWIKGNVIPNEA